MFGDDKDPKDAKAAPQPKPQPAPKKEEAIVKDADGAVIDAPVEDKREEQGLTGTPEKPPLNPYTKAYKKGFPARGEGGGVQQATPTVDSEKK